MKWLIQSTSEGAIILRTVIEVALSWFISNIGDIFALFTISEPVKVLLMSFLTVVITAVLSVVRKNTSKS